MAIYHCSVKIVSRGRGQSVLAKAAYNAREKIVDERTGLTRDYSRKAEQVLFSGMFAPKEAPDWAGDREELWNRVEAVERRKDAQLAREVEIALPHELTDEQRRWLVTDFVRENFVRAGMVADVNIHAPDKDGDERNYHAHILLTTRRLDGGEFSKDKARDWNSKALLAEWRADLAEKGAKMLERAGFEIEAERFRHGHLSLSEQRLHAVERGDLEFAQACDREPGTHKGPQIQEMEARGVVSEVQERRSEAPMIDLPGDVTIAELKAEYKALEAEEAALLLFTRQDRQNGAEDTPKEASTTGRSLADDVDAGVDAGLETASKILDLVGNAAAKVVESIADSLAPPAPLSRQQRIEKAIGNRARAEQRDAERIDFARYMADEEYRRQLARQREEQAAHERERETYEKSRGDRER